MKVKDEIERLFELFHIENSASQKRQILTNIEILEEILCLTSGEQVDRTSIYRKEYAYPYSHAQSLVDEVNRTANGLRGLTKKIVSTFKSIDWQYNFSAEYREYNKKYLEEIMCGFMSILGEKYFKEYRDTIISERIIYNQEDGKGLQIFYPSFLNRSYVFVPKNRNLIVNTSVTVHEFGHVFERMLTSNSSTSAFNNKFNISTEFFSMFLEKVFLEYLKKINFNYSEIKQVEEDYYLSILNNALSLRLLLNLDSGYAITEEDCVAFFDFSELIDKARELSIKDGYEYLIDDINLRDIVLYTYGGIVAEIFAKYYLDDKTFLREIENALFDLNMFNSEEILEKMPHVIDELDDMKILRKSLLLIRR